MNRAVNIFKERRGEILSSWIQLQSPQRAIPAGSDKSDLMVESNSLFNSFVDNLSEESLESHEHSAFVPLRDILKSILVARMNRGLSMSETSLYIDTLKHVLLQCLRNELNDSDEFANQRNKVDKLLNGFLSATLGIDHAVMPSQHDSGHLSTPLLKIWNQILLVPLIGEVNVSRADILTKSLLKEISRTRVAVVVLDISGVDSINEDVTSLLMKMVAAIQIMGSRCIISGMQPETAHHVVNLGIDFPGVTFKGTVAAALSACLDFIGLHITPKHSS